MNSDIGLICDKNSNNWFTDKSKEEKDRDINILLKDNYGLIIHTIGKYFGRKYCINEDIKSEGLIGLYNAVLNFDKSKGLKFSTFACVCIKNEIIKYLKKYNKPKEENASSIVYWDNYGNVRRGFDIENFLCADEQSSLERLIDSEDKSDIKKAIKNLDNCDYIKICELKYGLNGEKTHTEQEIANMYGVSRQYISKLLKKILKKLKAILLKDEIQGHSL